MASPPHATGDSPTPASAHPSPPAPPPWAFAAAYAAPLPPEFQFPPESGFAAMADWVKGRRASAADFRPRINTQIAAYKDGADRRAYVNDPNLSDEDRPSYEKCVTVSSALKDFVASGSIGLVTSRLSNAAEQSMGANDWHTVAMVRQGDRVWVHDPGFQATNNTSQLRRVETVNGNQLVHKLVCTKTWKNVSTVWYQGPPPGYDPTQQECMGRSAQWLDATVRGELPWPPDADASGGVWVPHSKN